MTVLLKSVFFVDKTSCIPVNGSDISGEYAASNFRIEYGTIMFLHSIGTVYKATRCYIPEDINLCSQQQGSMKYSRVFIATNRVALAKKINANLSPKSVVIIGIGWQIFERVYRRYLFQLLISM
jgi:hypothetical protein